jgi:hypothetical protein
MLDPSRELHQRAHAYANARNIQLEHVLGAGKDGIVFSTSVRTAVKAFGRDYLFRRELACYQRFQEMEIREVLGHSVPQLRDSDSDYLIVEMSIVQPPYLLDFASTHLDIPPPDFSQEVMDEWKTAKQEEFGSNWGKVQLILKVLEDQFGIYLLDVHPGNIAFGATSP